MVYMLQYVYALSMLNFQCSCWMLYLMSIMM